MPVLLGVLGPLLERRTPRAQVVIAAVVVTTGSVLVQGSGRADAVGVTWAVVALVCEAGFTLLAVPVLRRQSAWGVSVHSVWMGAVMFGVLGLVVEGPSAAGRLDSADSAAVAYLAVLVTAAAFVLWYSAVASLGAGTVGLLTGVAPISAALTGMVTGADSPGPLVWTGMLVVVAGLAAGLVKRPASRRRPPVAPVVSARPSPGASPTLVSMGGPDHPRPTSNRSGASRGMWFRHSSEVWQDPAPGPGRGVRGRRGQGRRRRGTDRCSHRARGRAAAGGA